MKAYENPADVLIVEGPDSDDGIAAGTAYLTGETFGVAVHSVVGKKQPVLLALKGVYELPAALEDDTDAAIGAKAYWNAGALDGAGGVTAAADNGLETESKVEYVLIGAFAAPATGGDEGGDPLVPPDETCRVRLNGLPVVVPA
jgi:predicted RecA/RadA family phage recombinase